MVAGAVSRVADAGVINRRRLWFPADSGRGQTAQQFDFTAVKKLAGDLAHHPFKSPSPFRIF